MIILAACFLAIDPEKENKPAKNITKTLILCSTKVQCELRPSLFLRSPLSRYAGQEPYLPKKHKPEFAPG